jgi:N-acetylmuramoyl-L-alanine amidase
MKHTFRFIVCFFVIAIISVVLISLFFDAKPVMREIKTVVVIDAGHGGFDSGAIGRITQVREDVLNLAVAKKLKKLFENDGVTVIMTREDDQALGTTKDGDMQKRRSIIGESNADIVISIHMNKFQDSSVAGPMAFYYEQSEEGKKLAELIQVELNAALEPARPRTFKPESYFILRAGDCPCVLVECGFISNEKEEYLLQTEDYQSKCADAIFAGAKSYLTWRFENDIHEEINQ